MKRLHTALLVIGLLVFGSALAGAQEPLHYDVSWYPVSDPNVAEVLVYRSLTGTAGDWNEIAAVSPADSVYTDAVGLDYGTIYYYSFRTRDAIGAMSGFSGILTGLSLDEDSPAGVADYCVVDSVSIVDATTAVVHWSTAWPTTGRVKYWAMGSSAVSESGRDETLATTHATTLAGLEANRVYFVKALSHDAAAGGLVVSAAATFTSNDLPGQVRFLASGANVTVPEGGTASFGLSLSAPPPGPVTVGIARVAGDADIGVETASRTVTFDGADWAVEKPIVLTADGDVDAEDGVAWIVVSCIAGASIPDLVVEAVENDQGTGGNPNGDLAAGHIAIYPIPFQPAAGLLNVANLPDAGILEIYDLAGRMVWDAAWSGNTFLEWDGRNNSAVDVASGRYFVLVKEDSGLVVDKRVILVVR